MSIPPLQPPPDLQQFDQDTWLVELYRWCYDTYLMLTDTAVIEARQVVLTYEETSTNQTLNKDVTKCLAAISVTLPTAVGKTGRVYIVDNDHAGVTTILPTGTETIEGAASQSITGQGAMSFYSDGSNWRII